MGLERAGVTLCPQTLPLSSWSPETGGAFFAKDSEYCGLGWGVGQSQFLGGVPVLLRGGGGPCVGPKESLEKNVRKKSET